jgi:Zn-dependent M28 family amino/carboxypeptidase
VIRAPRSCLTVTRPLTVTLALALTLALAACGGGTTREPLPPTEPAALLATLDDLAAFGEKRCGTDAGRQAAAYVAARMTAAGLEDVHEEPFAFPQHTVSAASFTVAVDGAPAAAAFDVFEASGGGTAEGAAVVYVGSARPSDLQGVDLTGKVAMVERDQTIHRSLQYRHVTDAGAAAMLYLSTAPDNLRQVGSVRLTWEAQSTIPAVTIGAVDGAAIKAALAAGAAVTASFAVVTTAVPAQGQNVVGRVRGTDEASGLLLVGAHYDTWFVGSTDNGGGVAALLAVAERIAAGPPPRYGIVFVAYDGEELALYGGYHFLRTHVTEAGEPILAALNFEVPAAKETSLLGLAYSGDAPLEEALRGAGLSSVYPLFLGMEGVPSLFGGIIPTDIQGLYRANIAVASTASSSSWYHTTADTPDKVDIDALAPAVDAFAATLLALGDAAPATLRTNDPALWLAQVTVAPSAAGGPLAVTAAITDAAGAPQAGAPAHATLLYDDFFLALEADATTDAAGQVTFSFPADQAALGSGRRFVHVTAGPAYPLVEVIAAVP